MKRIALVALLVATVPTAHAGVIFGNITVNNKPLAATNLTITCNSSYSASTNEQGSYSVRVNELGKCTLTLSYDGQQPSQSVYSTEGSARHDFRLERDAAGNWYLRAQ